jgi:hydrogenase nickel incorporation protein HypA/HybF
MHELSIMTSLMARVCEIAKTEKAEKITAVNLKNGAFSGVISEALEFCFDVCAAGTPAEKAMLNIRLVPAMWQCESCGAKVYEVEDKSVPICPKCAGVKLKLISGKEFELESIEVE